MTAALLALGALLLAPPAAPRPDRQSLLERAGRASAEGRRAEAERLYRDAATRFRSVRAMVELARLQMADGRQSEALATLGAARERAPHAEDVLSAYAQVALAARAPVPAAEVLAPLTRMCPTVPAYHYRLGIALLQAGDVTGAVESLQRAQAIEPDRPLTLAALGLALVSAKRHDEAKPLLARSLDLEPDGVEALAALAEAEEGLGELGPAEDHAVRALARQPDHPTANLALGMVRMKQDRYAEARAPLERAARAAADLPKAHYQLSLAYARLGEDALSERHRALYAQGLQEVEARMKALRAATGTAPATEDTTR
ncbi:MAG: tetratricopeptide repeat protein [Vicinamibacteria bacterium]